MPVWWFKLLTWEVGSRFQRVISKAIVIVIALLMTNVPGGYLIGITIQDQGTLEYFAN